MNIIVTGAAGWIGRELCRYLQSQGHWVLAFDLEESEGPWDAFVAGNISYDEGMPSGDVLGALGDIDALIHCAGYAHRPVETEEEVKRFFAINDEGTGRVIDLAKTMGVSRFLYVSSIAFYEWNLSQKDSRMANGKKNEEDPVSGLTAYAESKLAGEERVKASGLDYRIVRLATVFGQGDRANFSKLAGALKAKRFILPGKGSARKSVISVDVAVELMARFAVLDDPKYRLINLGFPIAPSLGEICAAYARVCGFPSPRKIPVCLLKLMALAGDMVSLLKPNFPLNSNNVRKLTTSTEVCVDKMLELFPDMANRDFESALEHCGEYYRIAEGDFKNQGARS